MSRKHPKLLDLLLKSASDTEYLSVGQIHESMSRFYFANRETLRVMLSRCNDYFIKHRIDCPHCKRSYTGYKIKKGRK